MIFAKKVCRRCFGHAISVKDVNQLDRVPNTTYYVSTTGCFHKPPEHGDQSKTECGIALTERWAKELR
jgi:hypothetical protein